MFVADTSLAATAWRVFFPEIEYKLRVEIQNAKTWLDANKLTLNEEKPSIQLFQLRLSTCNAEMSSTSAKGCWELLTN